MLFLFFLIHALLNLMPGILKQKNVIKPSNATAKIALSKNKNMGTIAKKDV